MIDVILRFFSIHGYIAELILSCLLFVVRLPRRKLFIVRVLVSVALFLGISYLFNYLETLYLTGHGPMFLPMVKYTLFISLAFLTIWFSFDVKFIIALFLGVSAAATQHFSYKLGELSVRLLGVYLTTVWSNVLYIAVLFISYTAIYFLFARKMKNIEQEYLEVKSTIYISIALVLYTTMFQYSTSMQIELYVVYALYDMLCCALTLIVQINVIRAGKYLREYNVIQHLNYERQSQYDIAKKNIELLNIKFHDLKKMISNLSTAISLDEKYELERAISIYDTTIKTGNEVLDVILTEKSMFCDQMGIRFERIVDGSILDFISNTDLYSLLGNAMDNAIEAVSKIEKPEERVISLMIRKSHGVVLIHVENGYVGEIDFIDGMPQTTKGNKIYHGFGVKSIKNVVDKYDGSFKIRAKNGVFSLNVIFPIAKAKAIETAGGQ